jgi:hypothetical protein
MAGGWIESNAECFENSYSGEKSHYRSNRMKKRVRHSLIGDVMSHPKGWHRIIMEKQWVAS